MKIIWILIGMFVMLGQNTFAQSTYDLWLGSSKALKTNESLIPASICMLEKDECVKEELMWALSTLAIDVPRIIKDSSKADLIVCNYRTAIEKGFLGKKDIQEEDESYIIKHNGERIIIAAKTSTAKLYGIYRFVELLKTEAIATENYCYKSAPVYKNRILNHWDNLDGSVERGYAGRSIWKWNELPKINQRYVDYARANASIGINGTVLNNVNANPDILKEEYLEKVKALADVFRPYGIRVYLSINFASPQVIGGLSTSDPRNAEVVQWWNEKVDEIYALIPDFGGFLVKANSEGQPGPMDFGATHADGANMLAKPLAKHGGLVMWRAFVYNPQGNDRGKQAYDEFMPLDGKFADNVIVQIKNGPVDFQPREPFSPLFGAAKHTNMMAEVQLTQEYLGFSTHLAYLGTMFAEFLRADTYHEDKAGATIVDRTTQYENSAIAGVANIGLDDNWCGYVFAQANWYAFGKLAWNPNADVRELAKDWARQSISTDEATVDAVSTIMMQSREAVVNYMTPMGLHHLMGWDHHHGPEPWCEIEGARPDWLPTYYHKADSCGIGFNRSKTGTNATAQYNQPLREIYDSEELCPTELLLWFHHLSWNHNLANGNTLWQQLCYQYQAGVDKVKEFNQEWEAHEGKVSPEVYAEVKAKLAKQLDEAIWWHDACLLYFQTFSNQPFPTGIDQPIKTLEEMKKIKFDLKHHN
ncbi:MAG: alpha-glucuronidase [Bacteroidales bacterium]